jgi:hypothetical protein
MLRLVPFVFAAGGIALASWLDATGFFEQVMPLPVFGAGLILFLTPICWSEQRRPRRWAPLVLTAGYLLALPGIRWDREKAFFIDARGIELGMSEGDVRRIMEPYLELGTERRITGDDVDWFPFPAPAAGRLYYTPEAGSYHWCEVSLDRRGVTGVEVFYDD